MSNEEDNPAISDEDLALWATVTQHDQPMPGKSLKQKPQRKKKDSDKEPQQEATDTEPVQTSSSVESKNTSLPELAPGDVVGVDKNLATKLRKGQLTPDLKLDLHGHTLEEAEQQLRYIILTSFDLGKRVLLVITGKGLRSEAGKATIKSELPHWLNQPGMRDKVLMFAAAQPKDGGDGAMYVLLKKNRNRE